MVLIFSLLVSSYLLHSNLFYFILFLWVFYIFEHRFINQNGFLLSTLLKCAACLTAQMKTMWRQVFQVDYDDYFRSYHLFPSYIVDQSFYLIISDITIYMKTATETGFKYEEYIGPEDNLGGQRARTYLLHCH